MIPNDQPLRKQIIKRMLDDLDTAELGDFTQWEANFIESINDQFDKRQDLSDRQCEILEKIYDKTRKEYRG